MTSLVHFEHPPITEMAIGAQFASFLPLRSFDFADAWTAFGRDKYPHYTEMPMLDPIATGDLQSQILIQIPLNFASAPPQRYWFLTSSQERLIQLQSNRLLYNWRKLPATLPNDYPRYDSLIESYFEALRKFDLFVKTIGLKLEPQVADMTYVNSIVLQTGQGLSDILRGSFALDTPSVEVRAGTQVHFWQFVVEELKTTINVNANLQRNVLRLELSASGLFSLEDSELDIDAMRDRYNIFHDKLNALFVDMTTDWAHQQWRRI